MNKLPKFNWALFALRVGIAFAVFGLTEWTNLDEQPMFQQLVDLFAAQLGVSGEDQILGTTLAIFGLSWDLIGYTKAWMTGQGDEEATMRGE